MPLCKSNHKHVRFNVPTVVLMNIPVFWDMTTYGLVLEEFRVYSAQQDLNLQLRSIKIQGIQKRMVQFQFLGMLENWLLPQPNTNYDDYILQLDSAPPRPPHFHRNV